VLRRRLLPAGRPGTWRTLWADQDAERLGGALGDLRSTPLFGGAQVLVVRRAEKLAARDETRVLDALPTLGAGGTLVLVVAGDPDQRRKLFAACLRARTGVGFPELDAGAAGPWVARLARERGHEIAPAAVAELVERSGPSLGVLAGELDKLSLHVGPGVRIEPEHVRAMATTARSHRVEELTDRLARRDLAGAARVLRQLSAEGVSPILIVAFVAANLRRALHVAELAEQGLAPAAIAERLGMPRWLVDRNRGRGHAADLERALLVLRRLDLELKSAHDEEACLDAALLEIASVPDPKSVAKVGGGSAALARRDDEE